MPRRPQKVYKLNYWKVDPELTASITIYGNPPEVRVAAEDDIFFSARGGELGGLSMSPGRGNNINIQAMNGNMRFGGLLQNLDFPLSIIPITPFTPFPVQRFSPPLAAVLPTIRDLTIISTSFIGL